tara:strand:- start:12891 stop:16145 length:3255 start_codon:yes stop_codon:yes gene_type:complete
MILASAGSGKTYALTNRFVKLLALGVAPEKIIALTFTRKAAAEFLDEILRKLAKACTDPNFAAAVRDQIEVPGFSPEVATGLLQQVVGQLHMLSLGTLDSFFNRVLSSFPAEFGLSAKFDIMEPNEVSAAQREVFASLFDEDRLHDAFTESFKQATFGIEEKQLVRALDGFVSRYHELYLRAPKRELWGEERTIWPEGCRWLRGIGDVDLECEELLSSLSGVEFDKRAWKMWDEFIELIREMKPGRALPKPKALQARLFEGYHEIHEAGGFEVSLYGKHYQLGHDVCVHLSRVLDYIMYCEVFPHVMQTRGMHTLLALYEARYHDQVRRAGKLGFDDVQLLLSGALLPEHAQSELSLEGNDALLNIEYRLDGKFDHWLLDEFQDTSLRQWSVIENLADEVIQGGAGQRSFFYVGDVKQAIFGWRGGDSRLFHDIYDHYGGDQIAKRLMNSSYRSAPVVLDAVNRVFGNNDLLDEMFPEHRPFVDRWKASWEDHVSEHLGREGLVQLHTLPKAGWEDTEPPILRRAKVVAEILNQMEPQKRNLSCAVLVRRNESAALIAEYLRANTKVAVVVDGDTLIGSDHPIASSFLALLQLTAHPGDTLAWKHLCMTPALHGTAVSDEEQARKKLVESTIEAIHDTGFSGALNHWLDRLSHGGLEPDEFAVRRIEQLRQVTCDFDRTGNRSVGDFVNYARSVVARESTAKGVVQIMTIHKSKGLGFDAVIVAEIESNRDGELTDIGNLGLVSHHEGEGIDRRIEWVLSMPRKQACELDPTLSEARFKLENEAAFQELCVLYVALTRAKSANYIVCTEGGGKATMRDLVIKGLTGGSEVREPSSNEKAEARVDYEAGNCEWYAASEFDSTEDEGQVHQEERQQSIHRRRFNLLRREMPSSAADESQDPKIGARFVFLPGTIRAAEYGTTVHELFEVFPWIEEQSPDEIREILTTQIDENDPTQALARDEVLTNLTTPEVASIFRKGNYSANPVAWLEKRFELIDNGKWVSGTFDRVVFQRDKNGKPVSADVYDFKTNKVRTEEEVAEACSHYAPQLAIYRLALSRLLGIAEGEVRSHLIFTRMAKVIEVADPF